MCLLLVPKGNKSGFLDGMRGEPWIERQLTDPVPTVANQGRDGWGFLHSHFAFGAEPENRRGGNFAPAQRLERGGSLVPFQKVGQQMGPMCEDRHQAS